ncbi:hypothetical protein LUZ60_016859 [Juncus effusus]|nr:hypothetical protein LUZ60_016859 [Juncus effusus]
MGSSCGGSFLSNFRAAALRRKPIDVDLAPSFAGAGGLERRLGAFELVLLGIGASIGAGIFVVTGTVARDAGPGVTISFILAGLASVLDALCYAELATRFPPVVGGAYLYTYSAFNELTAFLVFSQLMLDYHIGAASIARSLSSYFISLLEIFPFLDGVFPSWIGNGKEFFGGVISVNLLAPVFLGVLSLVLCRGVKESYAVNSFMTGLKVIIVILVILVGSFEVDVSNWTPFAPNGFKEIVTGATVVFFAYVGFDAVANSAEETKRPQRDLPIGILGSLFACITLYVCVCLVITGMVPYFNLGSDAPLAEAFIQKGLKFMSVLIGVAAVAGLTTTVLVGLYVQSRLYLGLGRDGLLPAVFAKVHPSRHTPIHSQIFVGLVAAILAGFFNVTQLSHILSVGTLTGYSVVSACVLTLRWKDRPNEIRISKLHLNVSSWCEGVICIVVIAISSFITGLCYRFGASWIFLILAFLVAVGAAAALHFRQVYGETPGFSCPAVPFVPIISIFFNIFLFAQLHEEAWYRFVILSIISVGIYAFYGQYNAVSATSNHYHPISTESAL